MDVGVAEAWCPKAGVPPEQYEDAFFLPQGRNLRGCYVRLAVADGATESPFAGLWAASLVRAFGHGRLRDEPFRDRVPSIAADWARCLPPGPLPWYLERKLAGGAAAAFAGIELVCPSGVGRSGTWEATGIGDCCLVQTRADRVICSAPIQSSREFGSRPVLASTSPTTGAAGHWWRCAGGWRRGDRLFLMTDAIAQWFLCEREEGKRPWHVLSRLCGQQKAKVFASWLRGRRASGAMRNDDVTALCASIR